MELRAFKGPSAASNGVPCAPCGSSVPSRSFWLPRDVPPRLVPCPARLCGFVDRRQRGGCAARRGHRAACHPLLAREPVGRHHPARRRRGRRRSPFADCPQHGSARRGRARGAAQVAGEDADVAHGALGDPRGRQQQLRRARTARPQLPRCGGARAPGAGVPQRVHAGAGHARFVRGIAAGRGRREARGEPVRRRHPGRRPGGGRVPRRRRARGQLSHRHRREVRWCGGRDRLWPVARSAAQAVGQSPGARRGHAGGGAAGARADPAARWCSTER